MLENISFEPSPHHRLNLRLNIDIITVAMATTACFFYLVNIVSIPLFCGL